MFIIGILKGTMLDGVRCTESRRVLKCAIDNGTLEIKILMLRAEPLKMGAERYFAVMYMAAGVPYCMPVTNSCLYSHSYKVSTICKQLSGSHLSISPLLSRNTMKHSSQAWA